MGGSAHVEQESAVTQGGEGTVDVECGGAAERDALQERHAHVCADDTRPLVRELALDGVRQVFHPEYQLAVADFGDYVLLQVVGGLDTDGESGGRAQFHME